MKHCVSIHFAIQLLESLEWWVVVCGGGKLLCVPRRRGAALLGPAGQPSPGPGTWSTSAGAAAAAATPAAAPTQPQPTLTTPYTLHTLSFIKILITLLQSLMCEETNLIFIESIRTDSK